MNATFLLLLVLMLGMERLKSKVRIRHCLEMAGCFATRSARKINVRDDDNRFVIVSFPRRAFGNGGRHAKRPISDRALAAPA